MHGQNHIKVVFFLLGDSPEFEFFLCLRFGTLCSILIDCLNKELPVKMEQIESSETKAQKISDAGEIIQKKEYKSWSC